MQVHPWQTTRTCREFTMAAHSEGLIFFNRRLMAQHCNTIFATTKFINAFQGLMMLGSTLNMPQFSLVKMFLPEPQNIMPLAV